MSQNHPPISPENLELGGQFPPNDHHAVPVGESDDRYYVYLLCHATEPRFKIGKANDIYQRLSGIGGMNTFDLDRSLCVECPTEGRACKLERNLHHLFEASRIKEDVNDQYSGYTEYFKMECFDRVVKYLRENADLTGALSRLPPRPPIIGNAPVSPEERARRKHERETQRRAEFIESFESSTLGILESLQTLDSYVKNGVLQCGLLDDGPIESPQLQKIRVRGQDGVQKTGEEGGENRVLFFASVSPGEPGDRCVKFLQRLHANIAFCNNNEIHSGNIYLSNTGFGSKRARDIGSGICTTVIIEINQKIIQSLIIYLHESDNITYNRQGDELQTLFDKIPRIKERDIYFYLERGGLVAPSIRTNSEAIQARLLRLFHYMFGIVNPCFSQDFDSKSFGFWIIKYCEAGLISLGASDEDIQNIHDSTIAQAKDDLSRWKRHQDNYGEIVYDPPLTAYGLD